MRYLFLRSNSFAKIFFYHKVTQSKKNQGDNKVNFKRMSKHNFFSVFLYKQYK